MGSNDQIKHHNYSTRIFLIFCLSLYFSIEFFNIARAETEILHPQSYTDYAGKTSFPYLAIDGNETSYSEISTDADAYSSILYYSWEVPSETYSSATLFIKRSSSENNDDQWGIEYAIDGGVQWISVNLMSSNNLDVAVWETPLNQQDLAVLQVRINTNKIRGGDGGTLRVYEIWTEGEYDAGQTQKPFLAQSNYGLFESVSPSDFYVINEGEVEGEPEPIPILGEARAIAVHNGIVYTAGSIISGWRIEKRASADGNLERWKENSNGGDPYEIVISGVYLYIIGNGYCGGDRCWWIEKRDLISLDLISSFGGDNDGTLRINPSGYNDTAYAAVVLSDKLYLIGSDLALGESNAQWRLEVRSLNNGLSIQEPILSNPSSDHDVPFALATDGTYLYSGGYDRVEGAGRNKKKYISNARWRIEIRLESDLSLSAVATKNYNSGFDTVTALAVDAGFLYAAGVEEEIGFWDTRWVVEKIPLSDLTTSDYVIDTNYVIENYGFEDRPESIALQGGILYLAGFSSDSGSGGDTGWRMEARDANNGDLLYYIFNDIDGENNDRAFDMALDDTHMFVAGYETFLYLPHWRTVKRRLVDGSLGEPILGSDIISGDFRCKILIHVGDDQSSQGLQIADQPFKLQFAIKPPEKDCAVLATYADITTSTPIAFTDTQLGLDGSNAIPGNLLFEPEHAEHIIRYQTLETVNGFTNLISEINANEDGLWDFSLNAQTLETYCLRIVRDDGIPNGGVLSDYQTYPIINIVTSE